MENQSNGVICDTISGVGRVHAKSARDVAGCTPGDIHNTAQQSDGYRAYTHSRVEVRRHAETQVVVPLRIVHPKG